MLLVPRQVCRPTDSSETIDFENPKSAILKTPLLMRMLAGFISLCIIPFLCISCIMNDLLPVRRQSALIFQSYCLLANFPSPSDSLPNCLSCNIREQKFCICYSRTIHRVLSHEHCDISSYELLL